MVGIKNDKRWRVGWMEGDVARCGYLKGNWKKW